MSTAFAPFLVTSTPGDVVRGWIGAAAAKGTDADLIERVCRGLDWTRDDVQRLTDNTAKHLDHLTDGAIVKRLASEVDAHPLALSFRTRMVGVEGNAGVDDPEDEGEEKPTGFRFVMSDSGEDRASDIVEQDWDLDEFRLNPVAPYNHNYWAPPVGRWQGVRTVNLALRGTFVPFVPSSVEVHPMAVTVREMMEQGVLRTVSVGFRPKAVIARASLDENDPRYGEKGMVFLRNTLLECSPTPMPMNPRAARRSLKPDPKPQAKSAAPHQAKPAEWTPILAQPWTPILGNH